VVVGDYRTKADLPRIRQVVVHEVEQIHIARPGDLDSSGGLPLCLPMSPNVYYDIGHAHARDRRGDVDSFQEDCEEPDRLPRTS
jgi:hypothetical protein